MKAYIVTTSMIFAGIVMAHVLRVYTEGFGLVNDPWFVALTVLAAGLCGWGLRLVFRLPRTGA
jgi:hypothetical protein